MTTQSLIRMTGLPSQHAEIPGHIYVLKFSNGTVKVGSSRTPDARFRRHESDAGAYGIRLVNSWLSDAHTGYLISEKTLMSYAATRAGRRNRLEYFQFVNFHDLRRVGRQLAQANGELGVVIPRRIDQLLGLREVHAMYPRLDLDKLHQDCIDERIPRVLERNEYFLTRDTVAGLLDRHDLASPSRSVRHRAERRAA